MPELPEVQTTVDGLNKTVKGLVIKDVWTNYNSKHYIGKSEIKDPAYFKEFKKKVIGAKILKAERRAKNILIHLSTGHTVLIHMKMTGHIMYGKYFLNTEKGLANDPWKAVEEGHLRDPFNKHIRLVFTLTKDAHSNAYENEVNKKHLVLSDMRRFAKVTLIKTDELQKSKHLEMIGPEPLDESFTFTVFESRLLTKKTGKIKTVLMDQTVFAGVGNIYSDEALWRSSIHPEEKVINIPKSDLKKLHVSMIEVLRQGIDFGGDSMSDYRNIYGERGEFQLKHKAYRRTGQKCSKKGCGDTSGDSGGFRSGGGGCGFIQRKVVGGRSAHFCSVHQKLRQ